MRLFISYPRKDKAATLRLVEILKKGGQEVWIDDELRTGQAWQQQLRDSIAASDAIVLALTENWLKSPYCNWEFITAVELGKKVIPVLLAKNADGKLPDVPARISQYQWVDFSGGLRPPEKVQKFLDDLVELAVLVPPAAEDTARKAELAQAANLEIHGDVQGGVVNLGGTIHAENIHVTAPQPAAQQVSGAGNIVVGDTSGPVTINTGEKSSNWNIPVVLGLILALIGTIAAVVALLPEAQRNNLLHSIGVVAASETPTATTTPEPTATPTLPPTMTPTSTPERMAAGQFNVVVAGFGFRQNDDTIVESVLADDMSDIVFGSLREIAQIDNIRGWRAAGVGRILGRTPEERELEAARIAETVNADMVIYGIITSDDLFNIFEPEFYITARFAALEPELVGADKLGNPVEFVGDSDDAIIAATNLQRRLGVLRYFLRGLALYISGDFSGSQSSFEQALDTESEGLEVLYIFAGNAAIRIPDANVALKFYDDALRVRPEYARALVGRGIALYRKAQEVAGNPAAPFDASLKLDVTQTCAAVDTPLPDTGQLLAELALRCYQEAGQSDDKPETADIDVKVPFGIGQTGLWLSLNHYGDYWPEVKTSLEQVVALYDAAAPERQARIRAAAGHANAWLGLRLLSLDGNNPAAVAEALDRYRTAIALLRADANREYNQRWIDLYGQQAAALEDWLSKRGGASTPTSLTETPVPALSPTTEATPELRG